MNIQESVKKFDPENQFEVIKNSYKQIETSWSREVDLSLIKREKISNIIVSGLGGSAIGGDLIADFTNGELKLPYFVNRNYGLPAFADENTLVIASSYSGNTEETLSAVEEAVKRGAQIVAVTTGGKLKTFAEKNSIPTFMMQGGFQPRFALYSSFFALLKVFQGLGLIPAQSEFVSRIIDLLKEKGSEYSAEGNYALTNAENLTGFIPVIYGVSGFTATLAVRLKGEFNENSKLHAFCNFLPEMNHNEIIGWETFDAAQINAKAIFFEDEIYHPQIKKRIELSKGLIKKSGAETVVISSRENDFKVRLFDMVYLGDWISYYLALIRKKDPTQIENIIFLKENL